MAAGGFLLLGLSSADLRSSLLLQAGADLLLLILSSDLDDLGALLQVIAVTSPAYLYLVCLSITPAVCVLFSFAFWVMCVYSILWD